MSIGLGIGIVLIPAIFSWFTLRKGYSTLSRILAMAWLGFTLTMFLANREPENKQQSTQQSVATQTSKSQEQATEPKEQEQKNKFYEIGQRFKLGGFAYTIVDSKGMLSIGNRFTREKASDGAIFYLVEFEIENIQNETATVLSSDFKIRDQNGRTFEPSTKAASTLAMSGKQDLLLSQLQPGIKKKSIVAFELPKSAVSKAVILVIPEKGLFSSGKVEVALPGINFDKSGKK